MSKAADFVTVIIPRMVVHVPCERVIEDVPLDLTPQERLVANQLVRGKQNKEIAAALYMSQRNVKHCCSRIFKKAGVSNRVEFCARYGRL